MLLPDELSADAVCSAVAALLAEPSYRERASDVGDEIADMPAPEELVPVLVAASAPGRLSGGRLLAGARRAESRRVSVARLRRPIIRPWLPRRS